jgi:transposase
MFDQMLKRLHIRLNEQGSIDLNTWMIDSTAVRATRASSGAGKKRGPEEPRDHVLGRSRGGLTTKIHMLCDANGVPLRFLLSGGQASDMLMLNRCWMKLIFQVCEVVHASAADGF